MFFVYTYLHVLKEKYKLSSQLIASEKTGKNCPILGGYFTLYFKGFLHFLQHVNKFVNKKELKVFYRHIQKNINVLIKWCNF